MRPPSTWSTRAVAVRPALVLIAAVLLASQGCGKRGPPRAPIRSLPLLAREVQVRQIGEQVIVTAAIPRERADGTPTRPETTVRVLRMPAGVTFMPGAVSPRYLMSRFTKEANALVTLTGADRDRAAPGGRLEYADGTALAGASGPGTRFLYAVEVSDRPGRRGTISMPIAIEVAPAPAAPVGLRLEGAEGEVRLVWEGAGSGVRYNVYRTGGGDSGPAERPLNAAPIDAAQYLDRTFRYGETWVYTVRAVATSATGTRESAPTNAASITPRDVYPPRGPTGLAVAVEGRVIKVYWFPNDEADLGGYRVYRRQKESEEFAMIEVVDAAATSFGDGTVLPGVRYDYRVTAIDRADPPNESPPSDEARETVPEGRP